VYKRQIGFSACHRQTNPVTVVATPPSSFDVPIAQPDPALIQGNNEFALALYGQIKSDKENVFFSPYSISAALTMAYAGARGESEKQMSKVLHFDLNQERFHPKYRDLLKYIEGLNSGDSVALSTAQAMFAQKDYSFLDSYFNLVKSYYGAELQMVDFKLSLEKSRQTINDWVAVRTKNRIQNLIVQGMITELARLVLVNAIYFKASWDKGFDEKLTTSANFYPTPERAIAADFMKKEEVYQYRQDEGLQLVELPYCDSTISMLIFLPKDASAMQKAETLLQMESTYTYWLSEMKPTKVKLLLPKFKITSEFELSEVLKKMGMPHPFSNSADLSGITGKNDLMIDKVIHKAFVEVSEQGTEAAASTAVVIRQKSAMILPEINVNRPFVFIIKDNKFGSILFMGRVNTL
jgi:serpin B